MEFPWGDSYMKKEYLIETAKINTGKKETIVFFDLK